MAVPSKSSLHTSSRPAVACGVATDSVTAVASRQNSTTRAVRDERDAEAKTGIIFLPGQLAADPSGLAGIHGDV